MGNIGFGELAIICIVLIIAVGPERLPSMMKTLGKTMRTLRQASRDIRASTGIDELMREDFDIPAPRRPYVQPPVDGPPVGRDEQAMVGVAIGAPATPTTAQPVTVDTPAVDQPATAEPLVDQAARASSVASPTPASPHTAATAPAVPDAVKVEPDPSKHGA